MPACPLHTAGGEHHGGAAALLPPGRVPGRRPGHHAQSQRVHRLYVHGEDPWRAEGVLAYSDIVGMLYRFCRRCNREYFEEKNRARPKETSSRHLTVREVMTPGVESISEDQSLA